jgi:SNF family Na+-dependent transporter
MTSCASFNKKYKPMIGDAFFIAFINCAISFFTGFAVFSVIGYLNGIRSPVANKTASIGLAFVAYPAAIEMMPGANGWSIILSVTLFTLGIDSAFSLLEATSTVMQDSPMFKEMPRKLIALLLCTFGAIGSLVFSYNWGFTYFDVVDHFLNVYLMLLLGILECFGVAWVYGAGNVLSNNGGKVGPDNKIGNNATDLATSLRSTI